MATRCSTRADGDFHRTRRSDDDIEATRRAFVDLPWTMTVQRHGTGVVRVTEPGGGDGTIGDIVITGCDDAVLGCWAADCAPLVLIGSGREFAVVHAGWRGLAAGVVDAAVDAFGDDVVGAVLGPTIGPCCYEFGRDDLAAVASGVHAAPDDLRATTHSGSTSLDVPAAIAAACRAHGLDVTLIGGCTGCDGDVFSHRMRRDPERHVVAAWRPTATATPAPVTA